MIDYEHLKLMFHRLDVAEHYLKLKEEIIDFPDEQAINSHKGEVNLLITTKAVIEELIKHYLKQHTKRKK